MNGLRLLAMTALISFIAGCGSGSSVTVPVKLAISAVNYSHTRSGAKTGFTATNTNNLNAGSILSAAPESMMINVLEISTIPKGDGPPTVVWTAPTAAGVKLTLSSGKVDLSMLGLATVAMPTGDYGALGIKIARVGQMKGCLQGKWASSLTGESHVAYTNVTAGAPPVTLSSESTVAGTAVTFCTRADQSQLNIETYSGGTIGSNASFMPTAPYFSGKDESDYVDIDLLGSNNTYATAKTVAQIRADSIFISNHTPFTVWADGSTTITFVVDLNRMLRFEANNHFTAGAFQGPRPGMAAGTSYFFTTVFAPSGSATATGAFFAFVGNLGSVQGYQLQAASDNHTTYPLNGEVDGWLTAFLDANGNFISGNVMPDDDNALTILKGNATTTATGPFTSGATLSLDISASTLTNFMGFSAINTATPGSQISMTSSAGGTGTGSPYFLNYQRYL